MTPEERAKMVRHNATAGTADEWEAVVAAEIHAAVDAERERCAKIVTRDAACDVDAINLSAAIRKKGKP